MRSREQFGANRTRSACVYEMDVRRARRAFTLFELVVTLSIIVIVATLSMVGYQSITPPGAVNAARNELHTLLRYAREQAIIRGSNAMLIINHEKDDKDKFLRYAGVVVEDGYNSTNWKAAHPGVYLPEGTYFVPQIDDADTDGFAFDANWPEGDELKSGYDCTDSSSSAAIGAIEYPVMQTVALDASTGEEQDWIGYQFGPDGRVNKADFDACSSASSYSSKELIVGSATYGAGDTLVFERSDEALGILLRVNGVSYAVDDPSSLWEE